MPEASQTLKWLGGRWSTMSDNDLPLSTPAHNQAKTALRSLAEHVPEDILKQHPFPTLLPDAPTWRGQVSVHTHLGSVDNKLHFSRLVTSWCKAGRIPCIFTRGIISNRNMGDRKYTGAAAAVLYFAGKE